LVEALTALYVWPQSIADHYADTLSPRQIEKLYEVGNVAERAAARITALSAEVERLKALLIESEASGIEMQAIAAAALALGAKP
jgi:uncharacterized small protein (DUF1192 family)